MTVIQWKMSRISKCSTRPQQGETWFAFKMMSTITSYGSLDAHNAITLDLPAIFPCHSSQSNRCQTEVPELGCDICDCVLRDHHISVLCSQILGLITSYEGTSSPLLEHLQSAPARTIWLPRETNNMVKCVEQFYETCSTIPLETLGF